MVVLMVVPVVVVVVVVIVVVVVVVVVVRAAVPSYECQGGEGEAGGAHAHSADEARSASESVGVALAHAGPQSAAYPQGPYDTSLSAYPLLCLTLTSCPHAHVSYIMEEGACRIQSRWFIL